MIHDDTISISKYNPLAGASYIKLPRQLDHPRRGLINIQNTDDKECFKWCLIRYLNPADHNPRRIVKGDKNFAKRLGFKDIKFLVKTRGTHKIEKMNSIGISVFGHENKEKYAIYVSKKCCEEKHVGLLLIGAGQRQHYFLIKDFNRFMYDHSLHRFSRFCLYAFITEEILKCHIKDCFKMNGKKTIKMPKKGEYARFKNFERKIKSPSMIYADLENILVPKDNVKQKPNESYSNKYENHVACSYDCKLVCVDDKFSKPFKLYLGKDAVYDFISSMIEESKY